MKIGQEEILLMNALSSLTRVNAKDCIVSGKNVTFVVREDDVGKAIGKKGETIRKMSDKLNKKIEIFAYTTDAKSFLEKAFREVSFDSIEIGELDGKKILKARISGENKRKLLSQSKKLKRIKELLARNYNVFDVKIS
ncbi:MAG: NusA-like transcription termination signal-binding factor [archaeon]|nr:NusA-like transcription termination signal-binding factor [archaeon]